MSKIDAKVVADSRNEFGNRITTMLITMPRIILSEFNTHRMFSRNSASSRAIPFEKMVNSVEENPFIPIAWQKDHKGMQGNEYFTDEKEINGLLTNWIFARNYAVQQAKFLSINGATKQLANRLLEPFMWHTVIVTATEWENFFALRCPQYELEIPTEFKDGDATKSIKQVYRSRKDFSKAYAEEFGEDDTKTWNYLKFAIWNKGQAEIHMMALAEAMWDAYNESIPNELKAGEWHIPYNKEIIELMKSDGTYKSYLQDLYEEEIEGTTDNAWSTNHKVIVSSMMAARTSYTVVGEDQKPWNFEKYLENGQKLIDAKPLHASPLEHCAKAMDEKDMYNSLEAGELANYPQGKCGNFIGWIQYRKMIPNENITV